MSTDPKVWDKIIHQVEIGWCKYSSGRDMNGIPTNIPEDIVTCCLWGAVKLHALKDEKEYMEVLRYVLTHNKNIVYDNVDVTIFNDSPKTTQADVIAITKLAKELAVNESL